MSSMVRAHSRTEGGFIDKLLIPLIAVGVLFLSAAGFGLWAFMERQDYKNNSDQKAAVAAAEQEKVTKAKEAAKYAEEAKNPLKTYVGPADFGSVTFQYPKTWSGYIIPFGDNNTPLNAFFQPDVVPDIGNDGNAFALRIAIVNDSYSQILDKYSKDVEDGAVVVSPYKSPKVENMVGSRVDGEIVKDKKGSLVLFPIRNVTLKVWTEAEQYVADFNNIILPNLTFSP